MDILIHWGVYRSLRQEIGSQGWVQIIAIALDTIVLGVFGTIKLQSDPLIVFVSAAAVAAVFAFERIYLSRWTAEGGGTRGIVDIDGCRQSAS